MIRKSFVPIPQPNFQREFSKFAHECASCSDTCCKTSSGRYIQFFHNEIGIFLERGIAVYKDLGENKFPINVNDRNFRIRNKIRELEDLNKWEINFQSALKWLESKGKSPLLNISGDEISNALVSLYIRTEFKGDDIQILAFQLYSSNGYCPFFDLDSRLCTEYNNRPRVCREYPVMNRVQPDGSVRAEIEKCDILRARPNLIDLVNLT